MKIGIDLRWLALGEADGLMPWLRGVLSALFARETPHTFVLFHTVFNYHLFSELPPHVIRRTIATSGFADELQNQLNYDGDFDLLLRGYPDGVLERFPLKRQIVCFADWLHESSPEKIAPAELQQKRRNFHAYQTRAGAIAVPHESVQRTVCADAWTIIDDVFVMPPDDAERAADALLAAFARVAQRVEQPAIQVSVRTPPVVSIVTPSFNQGAFIRQTIDSVLQQDYPHIDYRVLDGGSTDDTVAILKSYGDRVKWVSEKDRGQTHAINKGMVQACGEIRAYLNSDDLLRRGAVSRVVEHFHNRPACDLVYGRDAMIDADGKYVGTYPTADYSFERLVDCCCISQPAAFWRSRLADHIGPFDESLHLVMDYDFWLRADRVGGVLEHIPDVLAHTRIHRQTKSSGNGDANSHARRFYSELFAVSIRHAGYVSSQYVHKWLYTTLFNARPWTRRFEPLILRVTQKWFHNRYRCGLPRRQALAWIISTERQYVFPHLRRQLAGLNPRKWFREVPRRVKLEPDLWLGPELTVPHAGGSVRLAGVPSCNTVLRVYHGSDELAAVPLQANEPADVYLDVPSAGPLRITFSESEQLPDGRRVSFKLHGTTLFSERDAA
jgi:glycosyltransferase involved in cell wall biosynthesis